MFAFTFPIDFKESNLFTQTFKSSAVLLLVAVILSILAQQPIVFIIKKTVST
jgi:hypothetical protein